MRRRNDDADLIETMNDQSRHPVTTGLAVSILTPVFNSLLSGQPIFTAACPIYDRHGDLQGVLGLDVNVDSWTKI